MEELERTILSDPVGGCTALFFLGGDRVESIALGMKGEKSRAIDLRGEFGLGELAGFGIEGGSVDAFRALAAGPEKYGPFLRLSEGREREGDAGEEEGQGRESGRFHAERLAQFAERRFPDGPYAPRREIAPMSGGAV